MGISPASEVAFKPQTPGKYPKENILHKEHGESLKSRHNTLIFTMSSSTHFEPHGSFSGSYTHLMSLVIMLYFTSSILNMFRTLIHPSSGACDFSIESPHWSCVLVSTVVMWSGQWSSYSVSTSSALLSDGELLTDTSPHAIQPIPTLSCGCNSFLCNVLNPRLI